MYLSNRDIKWAIKCGQLIVDPPPDDESDGYDETSIDLHLGPMNLARVWDLSKLEQQTHRQQASVQQRGLGASPPDPRELSLGKFVWETFSRDHQAEVPELSADPQTADQQLVHRRGNEIVVRRFGFLLWPTKERVGTPKVNPEDLHKSTMRHAELISFVNAKSTLARTGLLVHFTAPTIHANWAGTITLEITNLGPFIFVLREGDALAQLTVAMISSAPDLDLKKKRSKTHGQTDPSGTPPNSGARKPSKGNKKPPKAN